MWLNSVKKTDSVSCLQTLYSLESVPRVLDLRKAHIVQYNEGKCVKTLVDLRNFKLLNS